MFGYKPIRIFIGANKSVYQHEGTNKKKNQSFGNEIIFQVESNKSISVRNVFL